MDASFCSELKQWYTTIENSLMEYVNNTMGVNVGSHKMAFAEILRDSKIMAKNLRKLLK